MSERKQLLTTKELLQLMELQGELPRYHLQYAKLLNAYLILERESLSSATEKFTEVVKEEKSNKVVDAALDFIKECKTDITGNKTKVLTASNKEVTVAKNDNSKGATTKVTDKHGKTKYLSPFLGAKAKEVEKLYIEGYSINEISDKMGGAANRAGDTLRQVDWYTEASNATFNGYNSFKVLTGRLRTEAKYVIDLGVEGIMTEFNLNKSAALHFYNRAHIITGTNK